MTMALNLLCRVIRRRLERGGSLEDVLAEYPRLTEPEREAVREACGKRAEGAE